MIIFFSSHRSTVLVGLGLNCEVPRSHSETLHSVGPLWMSDRSVVVDFYLTTLFHIFLFHFLSFYYCCMFLCAFVLVCKLCICICFVLYSLFCTVCSVQSVLYILFCTICFHRANWHSSATLTEVFPCFFPSFVRQMPGYYWQTRSTARTVPINLLLVLFLLLNVLFCW